MGRDTNLIEAKLLSRCRTYTKDSQITEILEKRYSASGDQKNFLVLKPTAGGPTGKKVVAKSTSLLHQIRTFHSKNNKYNSCRTRNEFKLFIAENLQLQKRLVARARAAGKDVQVEALKGFDKLLKFEDFLAMNSLWNQYITTLVQQQNRPEPDLVQVLSKLSSADLVGAYLTVKASTNNTVVGMGGIVIWESQHNFLIVVPREDGWRNDIAGVVPNWSLNERVGGLKIVLKKNTVFELRVPVAEGSLYSFDIIGNRFNIKSYERANKKFKNHNVDDISL